MGSLDDNVEEDIDVGSFNHSCVQLNLGASLKKLGKYTVCTELSLDVSRIDLSQFGLDAKEEIKPDVCIYPKRSLSRPLDILKMTEMPLLAIEVLSPKQGTYVILEKFRIYFELGIRSCWLALPSIDTITVYAAMNNYQTFTKREKEVVDETLDIRLSLAEIFDN